MINTAFYAIVIKVSYPIYGVTPFKYVTQRPDDERQ